MGEGPGIGKGSQLADERDPPPSCPGWGALGGEKRPGWGRRTRSGLRPGGQSQPLKGQWTEHWGGMVGRGGLVVDGWRGGGCLVGVGGM